MRYKISYKGKDIEIRSENAALSEHFQSKLLLKWIKNQGHVKKTLDYGCGKLRYTHPLRKISEQLLLVDSKIQLERQQIIFNKKTNIKEYIQKKWNDTTTLEANDFKKNNEKYDLIICSNVLSAIPCKNEVHNVLRKLRNSLNTEGKCLIVNQHQNSEFNKSRMKEDSFNHAYGWVQKGRRGYSYYGLFNRELLKIILPKAGFKNVTIWIEGQSTFAECRL